MAPDYSRMSEGSKATDYIRECYRVLYRDDNDNDCDNANGVGSDHGGVDDVYEDYDDDLQGEHHHHHH